ncbi:hypothetical protein [Streptomyces sp. NPDC054849]
MGAALLERVGKLADDFTEKVIIRKPLPVTADLESCGKECSDDNDCGGLCDSCIFDRCLF